MAKAKLKTVERNTSVSREAISKAFSEVRASRGKFSSASPASTSSQKSNKKKK